MNRTELAIELLKEGKSFELEGVSLFINSLGEVVVSCAADCIYFENVTKAQALDDLSWLKTSFYKLVISTPELERLVADKEIIYKVWYEVYKSQSTCICTERGHKIEWAPNIQD